MSAAADPPIPGLGPWCPACQANPRHGYCNLKGCPMSKSSEAVSSSQDGKGPVRALSATDEHSPLPQPSDATELVSRLRQLSSLEPGWYASVGRKTGEQCCAAMREAAEALTQSQARATAAEGTERRLRLQMLEISEHAGAHLCRAERAEAALAQAEGEMPSREEIARVIEPTRWKTFDRQLEALISAGYDPDKERGRWMYVNVSLAKADAILALRKPSSAQQGERAQGDETFRNAIGWQDRATQSEALLGEAVKVLEPFAEASAHLHPAHPEDGLTLDGIEVRHWRAAASFLSSLSHQDEQG